MFQPAEHTDPPRAPADRDSLWELSSVLDFGTLDGDGDGGSLTADQLYNIVDKDGDELAEQVRTAMKVGMPFVMAHENDDAKDGCEFGL